MTLLERLDRTGTTAQWRGLSWRKPRHGRCLLCRRLVMAHPCWTHRWRALLAGGWRRAHTDECWRAWCGWH